MFWDEIASDDPNYSHQENHLHLCFQNQGLIARHNNQCQRHNLLTTKIRNLRLKSFWSMSGWETIVPWSLYVQPHSGRKNLVNRSIGLFGDL